LAKSFPPFNEDTLPPQHTTLVAKSLAMIGLCCGSEFVKARGVEIFEEELGRYQPLLFLFLFLFFFFYDETLQSNSPPWNTIYGNNRVGVVDGSICSL
jgi:hypothetical protein